MIFEEAYQYGLIPLGLVLLIAVSTYLHRRGTTRRSQMVLAVGAALLVFVAMANYLSAPTAGASP